MNFKRLFAAVMLVAGLCSCEEIDNDPDKHVQEEKDTNVKAAPEVAAQ